MSTCFQCEQNGGLRSDSTDTCDICGNEFCESCMEGHEHCKKCKGYGEYTYQILRDEQGNLDYLHGQPTGETRTDPCGRCDGWGVE